jgi:hypothetical protein
VVVTSQPPEWPVDDGLLDYLGDLAEPTVRALPTLRAVWTQAHRRAVAHAGAPRSTERPTLWSASAGAMTARDEPASWLNRGLPTRFRRLVLFPTPVALRLVEWWSAGAEDEVVTVARRLRLERPQGGPGRGWTMDGELRRLTRWHWIPIVVELWPHHGNWMMTMTPQTRVVPSRHYFRTGHLVLDRLTTELAGPATSPQVRPHAAVLVGDGAP